MSEEFLNIPIYNVSDKYDELERTAAPHVKAADPIGWTNFLHQVPQDQLEVFICLFLGMEPKEIVEALHFPNIARFYNINSKLKKTYREQNWRIFEYN